MIIFEKNTIMKALLLGSAFLFAFGANAQSFQFHDQSNANISGTEVVLTGIDTDYELDTYIKVMNTSGASKNIKIKRYEVTVVPTSINYFCWTVCYPPMNAGVKPVFPLPSDGAYADFVTASASSYAPNQLIAYHKPNGTTGTSTYRFVAFDGNNVNDSVYIDVTFNISSSVGVNDVDASPALFNIWPNPANSNAIIRYQFNSIAQEQQLIVTDMIGARKKSISLNGQEGTVNLNAEDLATGIYFVTIVRNGEAVSTKRLVISR